VRAQWSHFGALKTSTCLYWVSTCGHAGVRPTVFQLGNPIPPHFPAPPPKRATRSRAAASTEARDTQVLGSERRCHGAE